MTPPTPEELLRLARKAWPDERFDVWSDGQLHWATAPWSSPVACLPPRGGDEVLARKAEYAALLVLAGEAVDQGAYIQQLADEIRTLQARIVALVDDRDRLRDERDKSIAGQGPW